MEIKIHSSLRHKSIAKFDHTFEDEKHVFILMELCNNGTLNQMLKKREQLTEVETKFFILQIISAIEHMHKNLIIHRDMRLDNIVIDSNMNIRIIDFGNAIQLDSQK